MNEFKDYKEAIEGLLDQEIDEVTAVTDTEVHFLSDGVSYKVPTQSVFKEIEWEREMDLWHKEFEEEDPLETYEKDSKLVKKVDDLLKKLTAKREILAKSVDLASSDGSELYYKVKLVEDFLVYANVKFDEGKNLTD